MCKFNNHLFTFAVLVTVNLVFECVQSASLGDFLELLDQTEPEPPADYDVYYDQRQNGTENYRLKIDGVVVAVDFDLDDERPVTGSDDLSFILSGLGVDTENLTNEDLYAILASIGEKKTAVKEDTLTASNDKVPDKPIEGVDGATPIDVLRFTDPVKLKKNKVSGRKNFRVRLPGLLRKFMQPRKLN
jgi:hypothetical protein